MRSKINESVLHFLYGYEITGVLADPDDFKLTMSMLLISKKNVSDARELSQKILNKVSDLDEMIQKRSKEYEIDRISKVDLAILRWALYCREESPEDAKTILNEALRLSKKFSTIEASKYIHAVLDAGVSVEESYETCQAL